MLHWIITGTFESQKQSFFKQKFSRGGFFPASDCLVKVMDLILLSNCVVRECVQWVLQILIMILLLEDGICLLYFYPEKNVKSVCNVRKTK